MTKYSVKYCRIPTHYNDVRVAIVEAETPEAAKELLAHRLGDINGVRNYVIGEPQVYDPPTSQGRILSMDGGNR